MARIVALSGSPACGETSDHLDQRVLLDAGQHEAAHRRQRPSSPWTISWRGDLRADRRLRLVDQRPGDAAGLALEDLRQGVGVAHHVVLAARRGGDVLHRLVAQDAVRSDGHGGDFHLPCLQRLERAGAWVATGRRR